ncbi:MAG: hypothetical protein SV186_03715 [Candidatus Nanohaloarchaea archaeon]|nr:hypothetical protein [Candidatus Nanohaloarchaea archaeon]
MRPYTKILIGALMIVGGFAWYIPAQPGPSTLTNFQALAVLVQGGLGVFLALVGLFVVWIESDELKIQRELERHDFEPEKYREEEDEFDTGAGVAEIPDQDYDEVVEGTVDEVKDRVREEELDPALVLQAEKENKDRKTLKDWLQDRLE